MDSFASAFSFSSSWPNSLGEMLKLNDISRPVQHHLVRVYLALGMAMLCSAVGAVFYQHTHVSPFVTSLASMVALFSLLQANANGSSGFARLPNLAAYGFFQGCAIGSLVELAMLVDGGGLVVQACVLTVLVFASFAGVALFSRRRKYLYLGGMLASAMSWLLWSSLFNSWVLGGNKSLGEANVYLGLAVFCAYVVFDTQLVIERASQGDFDVCRHAADLFADAMALFVRILVLLLKNNQQQQQQRQEQDRNKRRRARQ